jgi:hypothetical protein
MTTGVHSVTVRAWDTSGKFGDRTILITVSTARPTVNVSTPTTNANVGAPVNVRASASPTAGHTISGWWIYLDGVGVLNSGAGDSIDADIAMGMGAHTLLVRSWDTSGAYGDQKLTVNACNKPAVKVSTPATASNVNTSINVQASATPENGFQISGWYIYLDGTAVYHTGAVAAINTNVTASLGAHTMLVRAWDSSGAYGDQTLSLNVQQVAVNVSTPADGAYVASPVNIQASATSAHAITGWHIYIDSVDSFGQTNGNPVNASLAIASGAHTILVRAWDSTGAYGDQRINVTVP